MDNRRNNVIGSVGRRPPGAAIGQIDAERFARRLTELCAEEGVVLRTALKTTPMFLSVNTDRRSGRYRPELIYPKTPVYAMRWLSYGER